jgi:hypothetical protein
VSPDARTTGARRYGPAAGEPPLLVDPRRWGGLIGLVGGSVFVSSAPALGPVAAALAVAAAAVGVLAALHAHYVRPVPLGPLVRPRRSALAVYGGCVLGQVALIVVGSRALATAGLGQLQPALVVAAVGLHFVPFAWAFQERVFLLLGWSLAAIGAAGLVAGLLGVPLAGDAAAVLAGLAMIGIVALHARGRAVRPPDQPV